MTRGVDRQNLQSEFSLQAGRTRSLTCRVPEGDLRTSPAPSTVRRSKDHGLHLPVVEGRPAEEEEEVDGRHRAVLACYRVAQRVGPGATQRATLTVSFSLGMSHGGTKAWRTTPARRRFCLYHAQRLASYSPIPQQQYLVRSAYLVPDTGTWYLVPGVNL